MFDIEDEVSSLTLTFKDDFGSTAGDLCRSNQIASLSSTVLKPFEQRKIGMTSSLSKDESSLVVHFDEALGQSEASEMWREARINLFMRNDQSDVASASFQLTGNPISRQLLHR